MTNAKFGNVGSQEEQKQKEQSEKCETMVFDHLETQESERGRIVRETHT